MIAAQPMDPCEAVARKVSDYLVSLGPDTVGSTRSFYGAPFTLWLWAEAGEGDSLLTRLACRLPSCRVDQGGVFHWEFVRFALLRAVECRPSLLDVDAVRVQAFSGQFVGTRVANWTLLRSTVRRDSDAWMQWCLATVERNGTLLARQRSSGLIEDEWKKPSFQYHAFSTALLAYELMRSPYSSRWLVRRVYRALRFLRDVTLPTGEMNWLGRGQRQAFGYASAVMALRLGAEHFEDSSLAACADEVLGFLARFQRENGSLPLVLRAGLQSDFGRPVFPDPRLAGWYSYNRYLDYLAFAGALLMAASKHRNVSDVGTKLPARSQQRRSLGNIEVHKTEVYAAGTSIPQNSISSYQVIPYIVHQGSLPVALVGGEEDSYVEHARAVSLPVAIRKTGEQVTLVGNGTWIRTRDGMSWRGRLGKFTRSIEYGVRTITIVDSLLIRDRSVRRAVFPRIALNGRGISMSGRRTLTIDGVWFVFDRAVRAEMHYEGPSGPATVFGAVQDVGDPSFLKSQLRIEFRK